MPSQRIKIPIIGPSFQNIDQSVLDVHNVEVRNLFVNELEQSEKRPGLNDWADLETGRGIDGLYWWDTQSMVLAVSDGDVFRLTSAAGDWNKISNGDKLLVGQQVSIDDNGDTAVMANGGRMVATGPSGTAAFLADADAPTAVTHLGFLDQYLLANRAGTNTFQHSEVLDHTAWRAIDIFSAESKPDDILALHIGLDEIVLFGTSTIEFWANDGVTPFVRIQGSTIPRGIAAKYSVALLPGSSPQTPDRWICLDSSRRVIEIIGRMPIEVSQPIDRQIQQLQQVDTAIGSIYTINGLPLYVLTFPEDRRTFVYNFHKRDWSEWDYFDQVTGLAQRYRGNAYCYAKAWNLHLVGDHETGKIYTASRSHYSDAGNRIRCRRRSGFVSHGTYDEKSCHSVKFRVKQSVATPEVKHPQMMLRYRDDSGAWGPERWENLGPAGDHANVVTFHQLGQYQTRQWEITYTENTPFVLADAEEEVEVLSS